MSGSLASNGRGFPLGFYSSIASTVVTHMYAPDGAACMHDSNNSFPTGGAFALAVMLHVGPPGRYGATTPSSVG